MAEMHKIQQFFLVTQALSVLSVQQQAEQQEGLQVLAEQAQEALIIFQENQDESRLVQLIQYQLNIRFRRRSRQAAPLQGQKTLLA
jgi:hypothetical protein